MLSNNILSEKVSWDDNVNSVNLLFDENDKDVTEYEIEDEENSKKILDDNYVYNEIFLNKNLNDIFNISSTKPDNDSISEVNFSSVIGKESEVYSIYKNNSSESSCENENCNTKYSNNNTIFSIEKLPKEPRKKAIAIKKNKIKNLILNKKIMRDTSSVTSSDENTLPTTTIKEKKYILVNDRVIRLSKWLTPNEKKEIKILRNRISAQKSRDKKKEEFKYLITENQKLKKIIITQQTLIDSLNSNISSCSKCRQFAIKQEHIRQESKMITDFNGIAHNRIITSLLGIVCVFTIIILGIFGYNYALNLHKNSLSPPPTIPSSFIPRMLLENTNNSSSELILSILNEQFPIDTFYSNNNYINNEAIQKELKNMFELREKFLLYLISSNSNIIIKEASNSYERTRPFIQDPIINSNEIPTQFHFPSCYNETNNIDKVIEENNTNTLPIKASEIDDSIYQIRHNIVSIYVKDYLSPNYFSNIENMFDKYSSKQNEITDNNEKKESLYLHMILPMGKSTNNYNNSQGSNDDLYTQDNSTLFELGCKIFKVNKIEN